jgi:hypothetical protein
MAPIIATLMQAGLGILAGAVKTKGKDLIEKKLGVDIGDMLSSEEGKIKLAELEMVHEEELQKLAIESKKVELKELELGFADVDSARKMQIAALSQGDKESKTFIYRFSWLWAILVSTYIAFITFGNIPDDNVRFADTILGFLLGTILGQIMQFFYGSSNSSRRKDDVLSTKLFSGNGGKDV